METRAEFEVRITKACGMTLGQYRLQYVSLPCVCDNSPDPHWAKINLGNDAAMVLDHLEFHCPTRDELAKMNFHEDADSRSLSR